MVGVNNNIVMLNPLEVRIAKAWGHARQANNDKHHTKDKKKGDDSSIITALNGTFGELSFCKLTNCYPDFSLDEEGAYNYHDCILDRSGTRVDAKRSPSGSRYMVVHIEKVDKQADMYALMIGDRTQSRHEYVGYILAADLFRDENIRDIGKGPSYVVDIPVLCKEIPE